MLTKEDLEQIGKIFKAETEPITKWLDSLEKGQEGLKQAVEALDKKLDKVQEDIAEMISILIDGHTKLEKRVSIVEDQLSTPT